VSKSAFGSVLSVQLGGISWVPVEMQSYPCTWLLSTGTPARIRYEPRWNM
jgi:hypothetical protein